MKIVIFVVCALLFISALGAVMLNDKYGFQFYCWYMDKNFDLDDFNKAITTEDLQNDPLASFKKIEKHNNVIRIAMVNRAVKNTLAKVAEADAPEKASTFFQGAIKAGVGADFRCDTKYKLLTGDTKLEEYDQFYARIFEALKK